MIADAATIVKIHIVPGLTIFLIFPFSQLVHVCSGFAALGYQTRAYQVVRSRSWPHRVKK